MKTQKAKKERKLKHKKKSGITQFKTWCIQRKLTQIVIRKETKLSIGCIHATWTTGKATDSTIKLIALVFGKQFNINEAKLKQLISTFEVFEQSKSEEPEVKVKLTKTQTAQ